MLLLGSLTLNRLVQYYAKRPQVQERLVNQIALGVKEGLGTIDIAIVIDAVHLCVSSRGIKDTNSSTITSYFSGKFENEKAKFKFLTLIK